MVYRPSDQNGGEQSDHQDAFDVVQAIVECEKKGKGGHDQGKVCDQPGAHYYSVQEAVEGLFEAYFKKALCILKL